MSRPDDPPRHPTGARASALRALAALRPYAGTPLNAAISAACLLFVVWAGRPLLRWAVLDATWSGTAADCRA